MSEFWNENQDPNANPNQNDSTPEPNGQNDQPSQPTPPHNPTPNYYTPSQPGNWQNGGQWNPNQYGATPPQPPKPPKRGRGLVVFTVVLCALLLVLVLCLAGVGIYAVVRSANNVEVTQPPEISSSELPEESSNAANNPDLELELNDKPAGSESIYVSEDGRLTTAEVAKRVTPVTVSVVQYSSNGQGQMSGGTGTGIIMSADGYIVTNAHVVTSSSGTAATAIEVNLSNGDRYEATLVGMDTRTDLAVLKIDATNLPYATFGDSDQMEIGETVIAIGNPGGTELSSSVSQGIISGLNRLIKTSTDGYSINCIQTDAAINPGNSGGPLVNQYGQVIGINSAKLVDTQYEGIGFAIPINEAKPVIDQLIQYGKVTNRPLLGITGIAINQYYSQYYGWPQGILIVTVDENADIATKGLRTGEVGGDIITHVDGQAISSHDDVAQILNNKQVGDQVTLTIYRQAMQGQESSTFDITITLTASN